MDWEDFEIRKKNLFDDIRMRSEVGLCSLTHAFPENVLVAQQREKTAILNSTKLASELKNELRFIAFRFDGETAASTLEGLIQLLDEAVQAEVALDANSPDANKKRGPRPYPRRLSQWIFDSIEMAKGDSERLSILIKFFEPKGEFDDWLGATSKGIWQGPIKKKHDGIVDSFESNLKWLNDFKKTQKKRLSYTNESE